MKKLASVLQDVRDKALGADALGGTLSDAVIRSLRAHRSQAAWMAGIVFAAVLVGVVIAAWLSVRYVSDPKSMGLAAGGLGLSLGGALEMLRRAWKEYSDSTLLLLLIEDAGEDQIAALLDKLIANR